MMTRSSCENADGTPKRGYLSKSSATRAAKRTYRDRLGDGKLNVYFCRGCRRFHVGHTYIEAGR